MAEAHTIPDDTAAHYARLINEAESMRQAGADALKAAYADLRADLKQLGWAGSSISAEVAAFKGAIAEMALDEKEKNKREEKSDRVDDYVSLLTRARARGERKNDERFDPLTGEFVDDEREEADAPRSDAGLDIVTKHTEIASEGEPQSHSDQRETDREAAETGVGANEGGDDVESSAERAGPEGPSSIEPTGPVAERATQGETGMVLGTGRERPLSIGLHTDGDPEARFETVSLHQDSQPDDGIRYEATPPRPMKSLPYASCFPELSKVEYEALAAVIKLQGVQVPIVRMGDVIVNGWNRYNIARSLGVEYPVVSYAGKDVLLDVIEMQREDRAWTSAQEQKIAARLAKEIPHRAADIMAAFEIEEELA